MDKLRYALRHNAAADTIAQTMKKAQKTLFTLLAYVLLIFSSHAQDGAGSSLWSKVIQALASGISSVNIDNATLGVDKGLIHNMVVGVGRSVEKNPKSTSHKDRFLVKDRLKIGLELGTGFVVAGTITYAQEWTLVYPVASEVEGLLSRKFVLDLFLPLTIKRLEESKLPDEYVVIKQAYFEGKGRLRLGDLPGMVLGSEHSISRVNLYTSLAKRYPDQSYKIMLESNHFNKTAHALWFNLPLINMPIFDLVYTQGKSERSFYEISYKNFSNYNKNKLFRAIFMGYLNPLTETVYESQNKKEALSLKEFLAPYKKDESWISKYKQTATSFTFFYLFNKETTTRTDYVSVNHSNEEAHHWWQWEDSRSNDWTIGIRSEAFNSRVLFSGKRVNEDILEPVLSVHLLLNDSEASKKEIENEYLPLAQELLESLDKRNFYSKYKNEMTPQNDEAISSLMEIKSFYNESSLLALIKSSSQEWDRIIKKVTGKSISYWKKASKEKFHSKDRMKLRRGRISLEQIAQGREIVDFFSYIEKARSAYHEGQSPLAYYRHLCWAFRSSFYASSFAGTKVYLLKAINRLLTEKNQGLRENANIMIKHRLYRGNEIINQASMSSPESLIEEMQQKHFPYILEDLSEIYYFF